MSNSAENLEQWDLAVAFAQTSAQMASLADDPIVEALARQHAARLSIRSGRLDIAAHELNKSHDLLVPLTATGAVSDYLFYSEVGLAGIDVQEGRLPEAEQRLKSIRAEIDTLSSFTIPRSFYQTYGDLLFKEHRSGEAGNAFRHGIGIAEDGLRAISDSSARYFWTQENSGLYRSLVSLEIANGMPEEALAVWESYRAASLRTSVAPEEPLEISPQDIRSASSRMSDQAVIAYALLPGGLATWVSDERGVRSYWRSLDPQILIRSAAEFSEMCSEKDSDLAELQAVGQKLVNVLISPVMDEITPEKTLVIEPDDEIADLPFNALPLADGRYLGELYKVVSSPGLLYQQHLREVSRFSPADRALVVGSTAITVGLESTPDVLIEAEDVARRFIRPQVLKATEATIENFETALPAAAVAHFAGHAISAPKQEGLLMFTSGETGHRATRLWDGSSVPDRSLHHLKLVVLSACATGKSLRNRKEVHGQIIRRLLAAGVPQILASKWNVDSKTTTEYMSRFYSALLSGESVLSSVQAAERDLRSHSDTRHPYFWAAFGVFGRG